MSDLRQLNTVEMGHVLIQLGHALLASNVKIHAGSQYEEDQLLELLLPEKRGHYVDIGAAHPRHLSNTLKLYERGWRGLLIEPRAEAWFDLMASRAGDYVYPRAVSDVIGKAPLRIQGELSSLDAAWPIEHTRIELVDTETLAFILDKFPTIRDSCGLLSVDVEGYEGPVFAGTDFKAFRPKVIVVEAWSYDGREMYPEWEPGLLESGYFFVTETRLNRFYVSQESKLHKIELPSFPRDPPPLADSPTLTE